MKNINDNGKRRKIKITTEPAKVAHIRGDGNCLFRAFSINLFGVQSYHKSVRETLYSLLQEIESNSVCESRKHTNGTVSFSF